MSPASGGSGSLVSSSVFTGVFIADEITRVRDKESGDTTMVDGQNFLEAFLNMSLRSACFSGPFWSGKKQNFQPRDCSPHIPHYQHFGISQRQIKGMLLYLWCNKQKCRQSKVPMTLLNIPYNTFHSMIHFCKLWHYPFHYITGLWYTQVVICHNYVKWF